MLQDDQVQNYLIIDGVQIIKIGVIGDGSCFYHCIAKAMIPEYQQNKQSRIPYVLSLRKSIANWMIEKFNSSQYNIGSTSELLRYIDTSVSNMTYILETYVTSPFHLKFDPLDNYESLFEFLYFKEDITVAYEYMMTYLFKSDMNIVDLIKDYFDTHELVDTQHLLEYAMNLTRFISAEDINDYLDSINCNIINYKQKTNDFREMVIISSSEETYDFLIGNIRNYINKKNTSTHTLLEILVKELSKIMTVTAEFKKSMEEYIKLSISISLRLKNSIGFAGINDGEICCVTFGSIPRMELEGLLALNYEELIKALRGYIFAGTNTILNDHAAQLFEMDLRNDFLKQFDLDINYFVVGRGMTMTYAILDENGDYPSRIDRLIQNLNSNDFAAEEGIIPFLPYILKCRIHTITHQNGQLVRLNTYPNREAIESINHQTNVTLYSEIEHWPNIVIFNIANIHFELIAAVVGNVFQTKFENSDPLIRYIDNL